jgi:hypothetical protein
MPPIPPFSAVLFAILVGGPVDLIDAPPPTALRPGFAEFGSVRFDPSRREVEAVGTFNLRGGFVEYLACSPGAFAHESMIALECDPADLKAALLLLGVAEGKPPETDADLRPIAGDRLIIRLRFQVTGPDGRTVLRDIRAEDAILNGAMEREMERSGFVFTGSQFIEDYRVEPVEGKPAPQEFAPRLIGEIVALSHRPYAILDNPLELPFRDGDYYIYTDVLPLFRRDQPTPVAMVFRRPRPGEIDPRATRMELPAAPRQEIPKG